MVQALVHSVSPVGQPQAPAVQVSPAEHSLPQPPQLALSVLVLVHVVPHTVRPVAHVHTPLTQVSAPVHAFPHVPQFALSVAVLVHPALHDVSPVGQASLASGPDSAGASAPVSTTGASSVDASSPPELEPELSPPLLLLSAALASGPLSTVASCPALLSWPPLLSPTLASFCPPPPSAVAHWVEQLFWAQVWRA